MNGFGYGGADGDGNGSGNSDFWNFGGSDNGGRANDTIVELITLSLDRFELGLLCPNPQDLRALVINTIITYGGSSHPKSVRHSVRA